MEKENEMNSLPKKLSDCIRVAIADLEKVEALPEIYKVNMAAWHRPNSNINKCEVCLAGATIAMTLKEDRNAKLFPTGQNAYTTARLFALDFVRRGHISRALYETTEIMFEWRYEPIVQYENDPAQFKSQLLDLANRLEQAGF